MQARQTLYHKALSLVLDFLHIANYNSVECANKQKEGAVEGKTWVSSVAHLRQPRCWGAYGSSYASGLYPEECKPSKPSKPSPRFIAAPAGADIPSEESGSQIAGDSLQTLWTFWGELFLD